MNTLKNKLRSVNGLPKTIRSILSLSLPNEPVIAFGWVRSARKHKNVTFIELNDGSTSSNLQIVLPTSLFDENKYSWCILLFFIIFRIRTGSSVKISGTLTNSPADSERIELVADMLQLLGDCSAEVVLKGFTHAP